MALSYPRCSDGEGTDAVIGEVLYSSVREKRAEEMMWTVGNRLAAEGQTLGLEKGTLKGLAVGLAEGRARSVLRLLGRAA